MNYRSVIATRIGGPEVLKVRENQLREPSAHEVRIRVLAAAVSRPDITARNGEALYTGTPLGQKMPFVPGYAIIGEIDAVGQRVRNVTVGERVGVLTVVGGYTEILYWRSDRLIPVPRSVDPGEAVTLILNYIVAYQSMYRSARVKDGDKVLIIGASGGIGSALLQLGTLANLKMYGLASESKHVFLKQLGAIPIDYHNPGWVELLRQAEPQGLDAVFDGMSDSAIDQGFTLLRRGGTLVSYGEPSNLLTLLTKLVRYNLLPNGKSLKVYGTSFYFLFDRRPYLDDWATLFSLLEAGKIRPIIMQRFPILEAAQANRLLESGQVSGNVVLLAPQLL